MVPGWGADPRGEAHAFVWRSGFDAGVSTSHAHVGCTAGLAGGPGTGSWRPGVEAVPLP